MDNIFCDVLVIGSGIAGLTVALKASKTCDVVLCTKGEIAQSNTELAQGGIAVVMGQKDKFEYHLQDTLSAGGGLCDPQAVEILVTEGPQRVKELIDFGAQFDKWKDGYSLTKEGAHRKRRILHAADTTGLEIENTLVTQVQNQSSIKILEKVFAKDLIVSDNTCFGAIAVSEDTSEVITIQSKATLIATGGLGQLYKLNTNPPMATGDGIAMAYRAGAVISDMEFIQFHPTTLYTGDRKPVSMFLVSEAVRGEGAKLLNVQGERFMPQYNDLAEMAPRDIVARAIIDQMKKTNESHVMLDFSGIEEDVPKRFPNIYRRCKALGFDITKEPIPVAPAAHYLMGGIKTNLSGETSVTGLYAAGEVSNAGVHGANRLASNSLLDGLVFGIRAAEAAITYCSHTTAHTITLTLDGNVTSLSKKDLSKHKEFIKNIMWENVGIIRNEGGLLTAIEKLSSLNDKLSAPSFDFETCETQNMLVCAHLIAQLALIRKESRGAHFREDFPKTKPDWARHIETSINLGE